MSQKHSYVLSVMSADQPGIVSAVTRAIKTLDGNISSCSQTVLEGYFTLIMLISLDAKVDPSVIKKAIITSGGSRRHFEVVVCPAKPPEVKDSEDIDQFVVTAFGSDQSGIVQQFSDYLAGKDINIVDLFGELRGDGDFVLIGQLEIPRRYNIQMLQTDLAEIGQRLGFNVQLQHQDIFVATNELRMTG